MQNPIRRLIPLALVLLIALAACAPAPVATTTNLPALLSPQDAQSRLQSDDNTVLLDVRTQEEWDNDGHAPDAILIPLDELENRLGDLNRNDTILVICRSGNRSQVGAQILLDNGFTQVSEVDGGMRNWAAAGLPVE